MLKKKLEVTHSADVTVVFKLPIERLALATFLVKTTNHTLTIKTVKPILFEF